ncbi:LLM class F420-dependent oxidoreductase [Amycolatopsis sp. OK19-0408]|uniref:LLM class F420-dependent oxidoreductase n=1 Tax=Amycolatopsis iheyensis TaxID=2945988 RepID=A0A9X2NCW7_9PSEU|nr:LLM class F420-dependent oxidoreductase [Amycolatopsis iheyensis]MCR6484998.1 LLM class F420-dependent oxidoreductase [Amycolatopsis iheyensis]
MKFGIRYSTPHFGVDPAKLTRFAQDAEELGFESLYVPEHIALQPGTKVGPVELSSSLPYGDPLDCLTFAAAVTSRILLGTGVLLLPYHQPVVLAKRLATVDVLSGGRLRLLTVGVGALPGEAAAAGVDFATRGRRADEAIEVLQSLWAGDENGVSHAGEFFGFENLCSFPKPTGSGTLPIHVGGSSPAAARRAGRCGDGFFPGGGLSAEDRRSRLELARATAAEAGHDPDTLQYTRWGSTGMSEEDVRELAGEGVTRVVVTPAAVDPAGWRAEMTAFARTHGLG